MKISIFTGPLVQSWLFFVCMFLWAPKLAHNMSIAHSFFCEDQLPIIVHMFVWPKYAKHKILSPTTCFEDRLWNHKLGKEKWLHPKLPTSWSLQFYNFKWISFTLLYCILRVKQPTLMWVKNRSSKQVVGDKTLCLAFFGHTNMWTKIGS